MEQDEQAQREYEAHQQREHDQWLEEHYFAAMEAADYESYRPTD